ASRTRTFEQRAADSISKPITGRWSGSPYTESPSFNIFFRIGRQESPPPDGDLSWPSIVPILESARHASLVNATPVFGGKPSMPVVRLFIADEQQFLALGGQPAFAGFSQINEILLRLAPAKQLAATLVHEYVHVIHHGTFRNQPRWFSEGLAESL